MPRAFYYVFLTFVGITVVLFLILVGLFHLRETSTYDTKVYEQGISTVLAMVQTVVGAIVGALSSAIAYTFPAKNGEGAPKAGGRGALPEAQTRVADARGLPIDSEKRE
jgi:hypothetical protein